MEGVQVHVVFQNLLLRAISAKRAVASIFPPNAKLVIVHQNVVHIHLNPTLGVLFFDSVQERVETSCRVIVPSKVYLVPEVQIVK